MRDPKLNLLDAIEFHGDPLNLDIEVPHWAHWRLLDNCNCRAPEDCYHADWCKVNGLFAELCEELVIYPRGLFVFPYNSDFHWVRWMCSDGHDFHTGGPINGPEHWCVREHRYVRPIYDAS